MSASAQEDTAAAAAARLCAGWMPALPWLWVRPGSSGWLPAPAAPCPDLLGTWHGCKGHKSVLVPVEPQHPTDNRGQGCQGKQQLAAFKTSSAFQRPVPLVPQKITKAGKGPTVGLPKSMELLFLLLLVQGSVALQTTACLPGSPAASRSCLAGTVPLTGYLTADWITKGGRPYISVPDLSPGTSPAQKTSSLIFQALGKQPWASDAILQRGVITEDWVSLGSSAHLRPTEGRRGRSLMPQQGLSCGTYTLPQCQGCPLCLQMAPS